MKNCAPIITVTIIETVPTEVTMTALVSRHSEEKWRPIEAMLRAELREVFGRSLVAEHRRRRIARNKFNQQRDQRDDSPDHEDEKAQATEHSEDFALHQDRFELPTADDSRMCLRAAIENRTEEWLKRT